MSTMGAVMLGDIVRPLGHADPLTSGCSRYADAVVVSVSPFVLVSRETDMMWSCTVRRRDFTVTGRASLAMFDACLLRCTYGLTNRRVKRARASVRRRNRRVEAS